MLSNYSIVMLKKEKYNPKELNSTDLTPRVLIIRVFISSSQYIVRYPNGYTDRVNADWLRGNGIYEPDHINYATIATRMPAVEQEFKRNQPFRVFLEEKLPQLYQTINQNIEAKYQAAQEKQEAHKQPITLGEIANLPNLTPTPTEELPPINIDPATTRHNELMKRLTTIDNHLINLIELWGGNKQ